MNSHARLGADSRKRSAFPHARSRKSVQHDQDKARATLQHGFFVCDEALDVGEAKKVVGIIKEMRFSEEHGPPSARKLLSKDDQDKRRCACLNIQMTQYQIRLPFGYDYT
ncbi:uncharacterized protein MYCFIDRAFT_208077 [Pseudocercospora fijiensis CIRAD86]|uniref:Uncharacterized protein n=1 Tax=Pseudocercospora fijiensis (strain CIRAD86) TaxID=383855 RepID=M3AYN2_PSEFD|nr:uncharacterized protein MYCFIDRAFT_208077 [Pseudocercospora fijiensis CIRAD86]EME82287.1 hypothetical protein MYCFIDRAFT_208077 [Pseudocercospora fijiensis CIRAD86]